jgi:hypothetical protein
VFLKPLLGLFLRDVIEDSVKSIAKREATSQLAESVRQEFLRTVAEGYSREVTHNISQYVKSVEAANVIISSDNTGERLFNALQKSFKDLEAELEQQGPDSPVIRYLQEKYGDDTGSVVGRKPQPVYSTIAGFSNTSNADRPWLNRVLSDDPEIGEILAAEAAELFERLFAAEIP